MKYFLIIPLLFLPLTSFAAFYDVGVGSQSIWIKSDASAGPSGEYITAPIGWGDDDYKWACWYWNGASGECSGFHDHSVGGTPSDGEYEFIGATSGSQLFCITSGTAVVGACGGGGGGSSTTTTATSTEAILGSISFGLAIIITILFIAVIGYVYNKITPKKPWQ